MSLTLKELKPLEEFKAKIEKIYEPLLWKTFRGHISDRNSKAVCTGGPRYVIDVNIRDDVCLLLKRIVDNINKISKDYEPGDERVWKGILANFPPYQLWVKPCAAGYYYETTFEVVEIEVLIGLKWKKQCYRAMVNITVAEKKGL